MDKLKNETGFGAIGAVLSIVVIVLLGLAGWMVYRNQHKATPTTSVSTKATTTNTENRGGTIVKLPIMAIQFTVPDSLKTLTFKETSSSVDPDVRSGYGSVAYPGAFFSLPSLETTESCKLSDKGGVLGSVWKVNGQYPTEATDQNSPGPLVKQFSKYYLAFRKPGMACTSDTSQNEQAATLQTTLDTALAAAVEIK